MTNVPPLHKILSDARHETDDRLEFYNSSVKNKIYPSYDGFAANDNEILKGFRGDLKNDLMVRFIYRDLLKILISELKHELSSLRYGMNSDGIIQDAEILVAAVKLARCQHHKSE